MIYYDNDDDDDNDNGISNNFIFKNPTIKCSSLETLKVSSRKKLTSLDPRHLFGDEHSGIYCCTTTSQS